jgi:large subunit ribosomal protein L7/L12
MALTKKEVIDYIKGLPSQELSELIQELQDELGLEAEKPVEFVTMGAPPPDLHWRSSAEFNVSLTETGPNKIYVLKEVRELTGLNLLQSKEIIESLPKNIGEGLSRDEAEAWERRLKECGAKVEIKEM